MVRNLFQLYFLDDTWEDPALTQPGLLVSSNTDPVLIM